MYFDHVTSKLNDLHVGCLFFSRILNNHLYKDDLLLVSTSATALRKLINCCACYGHLLDIHFNEAQKNNAIGCNITSELNDDKDILHQSSSNYSK